MEKNWKHKECWSMFIHVQVLPRPVACIQPYIAVQTSLPAVYRGGYLHLGDINKLIKHCLMLSVGYRLLGAVGNDHVFHTAVITNTSWSKGLLSDTVACASVNVNEVSNRLPVRYSGELSVKVPRHAIYYTAQTTYWSVKSWPKLADFEYEAGFLRPLRRQTRISNWSPVANFIDVVSKLLEFYVNRSYAIIGWDLYIMIYIQDS